MHATWYLLFWFPAAGGLPPATIVGAIAAGELFAPGMAAAEVLRPGAIARDVHQPHAAASEVK